MTEAPRDALPQYRRRIGVVFQDFRLVRHLSAFDNVALPLRVAGGGDEQVESPVREMLAWVGLADRASARPPRDTAECRAMSEEDLEIVRDLLLAAAPGEWGGRAGLALELDAEAADP